MSRLDVISRLEAIAGQVAAPRNIEIVEVELKGSGRSHLLRVYIDTPHGVTHEDCAAVSREMSAILDEEDPIAGTYELEVSSPGIERKLSKWRDWERFSGKKVTVVMKDPAQPKRFEGIIAKTALSDGVEQVTVELADSTQIEFSLEQVEQANLKFEW